eukprot:TRINITY_DN1000_c0_g1_i1.p2 TRINITY_DN1000_c0_g1~~TRINITY_DN1000_c0_g1_i1.p2  ORF type:complete len:103 (-),score=16.88 TRINITY_DN1000_c0_g1_i1:57-365(-)
MTLLTDYGKLFRSDNYRWIALGKLIYGTEWSDLAIECLEEMKREHGDNFSSNLTCHTFCNEYIITLGLDPPEHNDWSVNCNIPPFVVDLTLNLVNASAYFRE